MVEKGTKTERSDFGEWCQMTGWHGVLDFYTARHLILKATWLLVVLIGCLFAVIQAANMIVEFANDGAWVTSISYEFPKEGRLEWPNITVCGLTVPPINVNDTNGGADSSGYSYGVYETTTVDDRSEATTVQESATAAATVMAMTTGTASETRMAPEKEKDDDDEFRAEYGISRRCPRVVISCGVTNDKRESSPYVDCCNGSLENNKTKELRTCFDLKPNTAFDDQKKQHAGNSVYYLLQTTSRVELDAPPFAGAGFEVRLYLGRSECVDDFSSTFFTLPGTRNVISMVSEVYHTKPCTRLIKFSKMELPCVQKQNYAYLTEKTYASELCVADCRISWQMKYCGCYSDLIPAVGVKRSAKLCNDTLSGDFTEEGAILQSGIHCSSAYDQAIRLTGDRDSLDGALALRSTYGITNVQEATRTAECANHCAEPCEYGRIESKISSSLFVSPAAIGEIRDFSYFSRRRDFTDEDIKGITMLEMYYEMKQRRVIEKKPRVSLDEFISNIGGCLGVWSGISFLSIFQIFVYLARAASHRIHARKSKRVTQLRPQYPPVSDAKTSLSYRIA